MENSTDPGTSIFARLPLFNSNNNNQFQSKLGLRYDSLNRSSGFHCNPIDQSTIGGWISSSTDNLRGGVEWNYSLNQSNQPAFNYALYYTPNRSLTSLIPNYEVGLQLNNWNIHNAIGGFNNSANNNLELIASYYHHLVVHRSVRNPLESKSAVGIINYIDLGLEMIHKFNNNTAIDSNNPASVRLASSWQLNKNSLVKFRLSDQSIAGCIAFKSWFTPSSTISATIQRSFNESIDNNKTKLGLAVSIENFGSVLFGQSNENNNNNRINNRKQMIG